MKIELENSKVFFENKGLKKEIHPFWLRERVDGDSFVDKATKQRLFDPTELREDIQINSMNLSNDFLEITFSLGVNCGRNYNFKWKFKNKYWKRFCKGF